MSDIFVSYASEDREKVQQLVHALEATGWSVFWDRTTPVGKAWLAFIGTELDGCRAMVVVWSSAALKSKWVTEEATEGKQRGVLFPVMIESVKPPFGFRHIQAADFVDKEGVEFETVFAGLVQEISLVLGHPPAGTQEDEVANSHVALSEFQSTKKERLSYSFCGSKKNLIELAERRRQPGAGVAVHETGVHGTRDGDSDVGGRHRRLRPEQMHMESRRDNAGV